MNGGGSTGNISSQTTRYTANCSPSQLCFGVPAKSVISSLTDDKTAVTDITFTATVDISFNGVKRSEMVMKRSVTQTQSATTVLSFVYVSTSSSVMIGVYFVLVIISLLIQ